MDSKILTNAEALSQTHIPEKVLNREKELEQLSNAVGLVNTFVHGPIGSGKTLLMKHVIENYNTTKNGRAIYIDCSLYQTTNAIFHETLTALDAIVVSKSNYELTKRLKVRLRHLDYHLTICLDHFEHLKEVETVNRILSLNLGLIIVADNIDAYRRLNTQAKSNIANIIQIPSYTVEQAFDVLNERAEQALEKYTYSDDTLRKIAQITQGNMTLAFVLLKSLALKAESQDKNSLDDVDLDYEVDCPHDGLSQDEKTLLHILEEWKSLPSSRLFQFYTEKARHPKGERSFRNYMESLCLRGRVKSVGDKRGRVYEIVEQQEVVR